MSNELNALEAKRNTLNAYEEKLSYRIQELNSKTCDLIESIRIQRYAIKQVKAYIPGSPEVWVIYITDSSSRSEICINSDERKMSFLKDSFGILKGLSQELMKTKKEKKAAQRLYDEIIERKKQLSKEFFSELFPGYSEEDLKVLDNLPEQAPRMKGFHKGKEDIDKILSGFAAEATLYKKEREKRKKEKSLRGCSPRLKYDYKILAYTHYLVKFVNHEESNPKEKSYEEALEKFFPEWNGFDTYKKRDCLRKPFNKYENEFEELSEESKKFRLRIIKRFGKAIDAGVDKEKAAKILSQILHGK